MSTTTLSILMVGAAVAVPATAQEVYFSFKGDRSPDEFGHSISSAGDLDGDGILDLIVGAPQHLDCPGGYARAFSGKTGATMFTVWGDCYDPNDFGDELGWTVAKAGDVNQDGFSDVLVSSPLDELVGGDSGSARLLAGPSGASLATYTGTMFDAAYFGTGLAGDLDLDQDGFPDILIGAPDDDSAGPVTGKLFVFSGKTQSLMDTMAGDMFDVLGQSVSTLGDLNNDGVQDFVVGAPNSDPSRSGKALVVSGSDRSILFVLNGYAPEDKFGFSVSSAGDVNQDGFDDIIVGGPDLSKLTAGRAVVFSGKDASVIYTFLGEAVYDLFGLAVTCAGDVNGDGYPDLLVGNLTVKLTPTPGYAYLYSGRTGAPLYRFEGAEDSDAFGAAVAAIGDLNGDGFADFAIGAYAENQFTGRVNVYLGNDLFLNAMPRTVPAGSAVRLTTREGESYSRTLLVVTAVNGAPMFLPLTTGAFDGTGSWVLSGTAPPGLSGSTITLRAYAMNSSLRVIDSADEVMRFK